MEQLLLMGIQAEIAGHSQQDAVKACPTFMYAPVLLKTDRPEEVVLKATLVQSSLTNPDLIVLMVSGGKAVKVESSHNFLRIPVLWKGESPHTRIQGQDNVDFIFLGRDGSFRDMQVSLSTNKGHFFANIQRVYAGWVVRTRAKIGERRFTFAPSEAIHAYPGCNYGEVWGEAMADEIIKWAIDGSSVQLSKIKPAKWISPELHPLENGKGKGWKRAEVFFWNAVSTTGRVRDLESGEELAVRYHSFQNRTGTLPFLCPGQGIYYRSEPMQQGFRSVHLVRPS